MQNLGYCLTNWYDHRLADLGPVVLHTFGVATSVAVGEGLGQLQQHHSVNLVSDQN